MTVSAHDEIFPEGCPGYVAMVTTAPFWMGRPEDLPTSSEAVRTAASKRCKKIADTLSLQSSWQDIGTVLTTMQAAAREVRLIDREPIGDDEAASEANRANDLAFGIVRARGSALTLLTDAAVIALKGILEVAMERGSNLDDTSWQQILGGFDTLFAWIVDPYKEIISRNMPIPPAPLGEQIANEALQQWVLGHHVFMVFAQASTLVIDCLRDSAEQGDFISGVAAGLAAVQLMRGCQGALHYTGNAKKEEYISEIRPTLMPPMAPPKMSGMHWRDHEALIKAMSTSKDAWAWLAESRPDVVRDFRVCLDEVYISHMNVCEHFVGSDSPSLLASERSSRNAVGVIDQFREIRLRSLPTSDEIEGDEFT